VHSNRGPLRPPVRLTPRTWLAAGLVLAAVTVATGCGNRYRPVINPVSPTGPAGTPAGAYAMVLTQPLLRAAASATNPCPAALTGSATTGSTLYAQPAIATVIDFGGDSVLAQSTIGYGPLTSAIAPDNNEVYSLNCDGTISGIPLSSTLQSNQVTTTTLFTNIPGGSTSLGTPSIQSNMLVQNAAIYVVNKDRDSVGALNASSPPALLQEIAVAPSVVALSGAPSSQRVYAISQGADGSSVAWGDCATPGNVTSNGQVDGIDTATNAVSSRIPVGSCPVFGVTTPDGLRTFILNRGSGTVSVINSQQDKLDTGFGSGNGTIPVGAGPVYAAYFPQKALLVTSNYDSGTVTFINVPLDSFGNDAAGFGTVLGTVAVGNYPVALSFLGDGSRVYVALQGDPGNSAANGAVAVVDATSFNLITTIQVPGHPSAIASTYNNPEGKVYVVAPDSQLLTILRTDTDTVSAQLQLQGCGVDVHTNYQYAGQSNIAGSAVTADTIVNMSNSPGSGAPLTNFVCQ
jgi:DNA-binding beta-propeller fold protein YncE